MQMLVFCGCLFVFSQGGGEENFISLSYILCLCERKGKKFCKDSEKT